jgi:septal ring factor EnvC (AmiA/AmiB activator)
MGTRRHIGIASALIVLSQAITSFQSTDTISKQVREIQSDLAASKVEREEYFVRKTELAALLTKMDSLSSEVSRVKEKLSAIQSKKDQNYSLEECDVSWEVSRR